MPCDPDQSSDINFMHTSDQIVGGTTIQKMVEIGATTRQSQIYYEFRIPPDPGNTFEDACIVADVIGRNIDESMGGPYVVDMSYFQDTTQAGQLVDMMQVFWAADDDLAQGWIVLALAKIQPTIVNPCVQNAVASYLGQPKPYPDADCSPRGFKPGTAPTVPPGGMPHL